MGKEAPIVGQTVWPIFNQPHSHSVRYVAVAEVPDSFDHILRLRSDARGELMLGTGGTSKLTRRNRSTSVRFSGYSVMFPVGHPRCNDRRHAVTAKQAIELGDLRTQCVSPCGRLLAKRCLIESARVQVSNFLPTSCTYSPPRTPSHYPGSSSSRPLSPHVHHTVSRGRLGACSGCTNFAGECYRCRTDPVGLRDVLTSTREPRIHGEHSGVCWIT
jgi:hypothetical protein